MNYKNWKDILKDKTIIINEIKYDLSHLNDFDYIFIQDAKEKQIKKTYSCSIEFGSHCFTKSLNTNQNENLNNYDKSLHFNDGKETRIFCIDRYNLSKRLPNILQNIDKQSCHFTKAKDKFFIVSVEDEKGILKNYEIYFSLKKSNIKNHDVHIFINSAYIKDNVDNIKYSPERTKKISFFILLRNTVNNKKIKRPY